MKRIYITLKSVITNTIAMQYYHTLETNENECCIEDKKEYEQIQKRYITTFNKLISKEQIKEFVYELDEIRNEMAILENKYYFKQGAISGLTELKFLQEVKSLINLI